MRFFLILILVSLSFTVFTTSLRAGERKKYEKVEKPEVSQCTLQNKDPRPCFRTKSEFRKFVKMRQHYNTLIKRVHVLDEQNRSFDKTFQKLDEQIRALEEDLKETRTRLKKAQNTSERISTDISVFHPKVLPWTISIGACSLIGGFLLGLFGV